MSEQIHDGGPAFPVFEFPTKTANFYLTFCF